MDMQLLKTKMQRCKNAGSIYYHKGRRVAVYNPDSMPIERKMLIEAQEILQKHGAGAMFSVYQQLAERYKSLVVLLPVSQSITDQTIARALQQMQLVVASTDKMYCLGWFYGIPAKRAKLDVAQRFQDNAEGTLKSVREMLTYSVHLIQTAQQEMIAHQNSERYNDTLAQIEILQKYIYYPERLDNFKNEFMLNIPAGGADLLVVEDERLYNYITSAFARQIADSQGAYAEHQKWRRELLMSIGDDSAGDAGGVNITMGR